MLGQVAFEDESGCDLIKERLASPHRHLRRAQFFRRREGGQALVPELDRQAEVRRQAFTEGSHLACLGTLGIIHVDGQSDHEPSRLGLAHESVNGGEIARSPDPLDHPDAMHPECEGISDGYTDPGVADIQPDDSHGSGASTPRWDGQINAQCIAKSLNELRIFAKSLRCKGGCLLAQTVSPLDSERRIIP